jgi:WD40 repeat protein
MTDRPDTLVDRIVTRAKNHRVLGVLIVIGIAVISVAKFVGAIKPLLELFSKETITNGRTQPPSAVQSPGKSIAPSVTPAFAPALSPAAVKVFTGYPDFGPYGAKFSPKGHLFAYMEALGDTGIVKIYDVDGWKLVKQLPYGENDGEVLQPWFSVLAFSPDGNWLAAAANGKGIIVYNTKDWSIRNRLKARWVQSIDFSPDGRTLVSGEDFYDQGRNAVLATITISDIDGMFVRKIGDLPASVTTVIFSHDGKRIAAAALNDTVTIWDVAGHSQPLIISGTGGYGCVINHDNTWLASGSFDGSIKIWSTATGELLRTLPWNPTPGPDVRVHDIRALAISPDDRRLASTENDKVGLWDAVTGSFLESYHTNNTESRMESLAISPDGHLLAASNSKAGLVIVWQIN